RVTPGRPAAPATGAALDEARQGSLRGWQMRLRKRAVGLRRFTTPHSESAQGGSRPARRGRWLSGTGVSPRARPQRAPQLHMNRSALLPARCGSDCEEFSMSSRRSPLLLAPNLLAGLAYINFHTVQNGVGEIRGQITSVPEPVTGLLFGLGSLAALVVRRRAR
ncbi:MAG: CHRD domain-containing protein, partial [Acidobacteria bacterium]|nr:CHRD domain-containing protein [Acidobacteriota bacterium]